MEARTLLVDGDIVLFMSAFHGQHTITWEASTPFKDASASVVIDLEEALHNMDNVLHKAESKVKYKKMLVCLSCPSKDNFRRQIYHDYKANRKGKPLPILYDDLRGYLFENYEVVIKDNLEADDTLGILATRYPMKYVIMSSDKDLRQIPSYHYNYVEHKIRKISRDEADRWFYMQVLMGDMTDNYPGCPGIGKVKAASLVDENLHKGEELMWDAIVKTYAKKGLDEEYALTMARVARILRAEDYDFEKKEIKLWQPKRWN